MFIDVVVPLGQGDDLGNYGGGHRCLFVSEDLLPYS